jgi:REP element-mobilizing transposase RayT
MSLAPWAKDNSPAIHRWGKALHLLNEVPPGTTDSFANELRRITAGESHMHSFVSCLLHVVFSTKERRRVITPSLQEQLWPYLGGIARNNKMKAVKIGGVEDHVHILLSLPATLDIAKAVQLLKGRLLKVGSRDISRSANVRMASRLRRVQHWHLGGGRHAGLHRESGGTPPADHVPGGIGIDSQEARD